MRTVLTFALLACSQYCLAQDAKAIIEKSLVAEDASEARTIDYTYKAKNVVKELDNKGNVKSTSSKLEEILYLGGSRYTHLIAKDDKPLTGTEAKKEQEKFDRAVAEAAKLTPAEKEHRRQQTLETRRKNLEQRKFIPAAYDLKVVREEAVNGRPAWVIHATPRKGYSGKHAAFLKNMEGDIWIDKADYHWAKVTAHALDNFSLGLFLARVNKDSNIYFELARVNDEVWLPKFVALRAEARIALLKKVNVEQEVQFSDYKRYSSDSRIVSTSEQ